MAVTMFRGRLQSLFRHMPQQTYNWQAGQGSFKGSPDVDTRPLDIPKGWMKRPLRRLVRGFVESQRRAGRDWRGMEVIELEQFELLEPRTLRGEYYPRTFVCPGCGRFVKEESSRPDRVQCYSCNRQMRQVPFVEYHLCGYLGELAPPRCDGGCRAAMLLTGPQGEDISEIRSIAEWQWTCSRCRRQGPRGLYHGCPECRSGQVRILRADANQVYYPQHVTVINPPSETDYRLLDTPLVYPTAVAQALGHLPPGLDGLRDAVNDSGTVTSEQQARQQLVRDYRLDENDPGDKELLETLLARVRGAGGDQAAAGRPWEAAVDALGLEQEHLDELGEECLELTLAREAAPVTIDDLERETDSAQLQALYRTRYWEALSRHGISDVILLRQFPVAHIVAGYSREESNPRRVDGLQFQFFEGEGGTRPMYGQRTMTEALLVRLDPARVVDWLQESGVIGDPEGEDAQAWLFSRMTPVSDIFEAPGDRLTAAVLGLTHSLSHKMIRALARRSGLKAESLAERVLPFNMAFLIYPGVRSDFVLGGLEHVFRNYLHECVDAMSSESRCVFDPPCRARSGACAVCMFVSEVTCERFNTALSRHYLFGGQSAGVDWRGYW